MTDRDALVADGLMTVAQASEFLSVARSTLYLAMERGELPYVKLGRARRLPRRAVIEFAAANLHGGWRREG